MEKIISNRFVISLLIVFALIFLNGYGWLSWPKERVAGVSLPAQKLVYRAATEAKSFTHLLASIWHINKENLELKKKNQELAGLAVYAQELAGENEFLKTQIAASDAVSQNLVLAEVAGSDSSGVGQYLLIDKGGKDGLRENAAVIVAGNILIGQISEVGERFSKVRLMTDPNSKINSFIQESGAAGLLQFSADGLLLDLLPQGVAITAGQSVLTAGAPGLPRGLLVGYVERVLSNDFQIAQIAAVRPAADLDNLGRVLVVCDIF